MYVEDFFLGFMFQRFLHDVRLKALSLVKETMKVLKISKAKQIFQKL